MDYETLAILLLVFMLGALAGVIWFALLTKIHIDEVNRTNAQGKEPL